MANNAIKAQLNLCALIYALVSTSAQSQVFKCTDNSGKVSFSDQPCANSQRSEAVKIQTAPTAQPQTTKDQAVADYERKRQQKRAQNAEQNRKIDEAAAEVKKIKSDNYDDAKCRSARARMEDMKRRDPITYNLDVSYFEFQQAANLYCGN